MVIEKLGFLVRFWGLRARHATLGQPLASGEQLELLSLMQLVTSELKVPAPGTRARPDDALPAQLIGQGGMLPVEIVHVSAAALVVTGARSMPSGERVILRTADAVSGVEYTLPCTVAWAHSGRPDAMALVVDGIPARAELAVAGDAGVGKAVASLAAMGRQVRLVG